MPDLNTILSTSSPIDASHRAALAWRRISDKPTSITLKRGTTTVSAQTVRVEYDESLKTVEGVSASPALRGVVVFGVRDHPDSSIADTNIRAKDRFVLGSVEYQVRDVVTTLGEVQAHCEAIS
jgi:hypothetical protein